MTNQRKTGVFYANSKRPKSKCSHELLGRPCICGRKKGHSGDHECITCSQKWDNNGVFRVKPHGKWVGIHGIVT